MDKFNEYHESKTIRVKRMCEITNKEVEHEVYTYDLNVAEYIPIIAEALQEMVIRNNILEKKILLLECQFGVPPPPEENHHPDKVRNTESITVKKEKSDPKITINSRVKKPINVGFL